MADFMAGGEEAEGHHEVRLMVSSDNFRLAVAHEEMNSRRRNTMEDVHRIRSVLHETLPLHSYLGIYDGHGGRQIVDFLEEALENNLAKELLLPDDASIAERVTRAFLITDMESRKLNITTSGATAVSALIYHENNEKKLLVANVGDSRAVLVTKNPISSDEFAEAGFDGFYAHRLSYDHRADDAAEQKRVTDAGGFVTRNRVLGILAVSRSFGDHGMKDFVIAQPHISMVTLNEHHDAPILILACDGVWDVLSDQEAADLILQRFYQEGPFEDAAEYLVRTSIERGSSDNVTAIVVFF